MSLDLPYEIERALSDAAKSQVGGGIAPFLTCEAARLNQPLKFIKAHTLATSPPASYLRSNYQNSESR